MGENPRLLNMHISHQRPLSGPDSRKGPFLIAMGEIYQAQGQSGEVTHSLFCFHSMKNDSGDLVAPHSLALVLINRPAGV